MIQGHATAFTATHYRSVFLSDFHMGSRSFDALALLDFLKSIECDYLFLIGDIIDGWKLNKRWFWSDDCNAIFDEISRKSSEHGTKIIYLPGNHDEEIRSLTPFSRNLFSRKLNIKIKNKVIHTMANGCQFLVLHGDQFDRKILRGALPKWTDLIYEKTTKFINACRKSDLQQTQEKRFSLAKTLKKQGKMALYIMNNFENAIYNATQKQEVDGLICGHTHIPTIKTIKDITYANAGSWVGQTHTALVEHHDGHLELIEQPNSYCTQIHMDTLTPMNAISWKIVPDASAYRPKTEVIVQKIQELWPVRPIKQLQEKEKPSFPFLKTDWTNKLKKPNLVPSSLLNILKRKDGTYIIG